MIHYVNLSRLEILVSINQVAEYRKVK
jgi:hypothetical protein